MRPEHGGCQPFGKPSQDAFLKDTLKLFDVTNIPVLSKALDAYSLRHKAIASNIANINTVGYKPKTVTFEDQLSGALRSGSQPGALTNERHIPLGTSDLANAQPEVVETRSAYGSVNDPLASGANDVDIDEEMAELAKNQIRFKFSARLLSDTFKAIQTSIRGTT